MQAARNFGPLKGQPRLPRHQQNRADAHMVGYFDMVENANLILHPQSAPEQAQAVLEGLVQALVCGDRFGNILYT